MSIGQKWKCIIKRKYNDSYLWKCMMKLKLHSRIFLEMQKTKILLQNISGNELANYNSVSKYFWKFHWQTTISLQNIYENGLANCNIVTEYFWKFINRQKHHCKVFLEMR